MKAFAQKGLLEDSRTVAVLGESFPEGPSTLSMTCPIHSNRSSGYAHCVHVDFIGIENFYSGPPAEFVPVLFEINGDSVSLEVRQI